jgi:hypothetical protein
VEFRRFDNWRHRSRCFHFESKKRLHWELFFLNSF